MTERIYITNGSEKYWMDVSNDLWNTITKNAFGETADSVFKDLVADGEIHGTEDGANEAVAEAEERADEQEDEDEAKAEAE